MVDTAEHSSVSKFWIEDFEVGPQIKNEDTIERGLKPVAPGTEERDAKVRKSFARSLEEADKRRAEIRSKQLWNYYLIIILNGVLFATGLAFMFIALNYSVANKTVDFITALTTGLGMANFIAVFFVNPQERIRKMNSDFVQMDILYDTWVQQTMTAMAGLIKEDFSSDERERFQTLLAKFSAGIVKAIEDYTEQPSRVPASATVNHDNRL